MDMLSIRLTVYPKPAFHYDMVYHDFLAIWLKSIHSARLKRCNRNKINTFVQQVLWGGEMQGQWPTADFNQIMTSDQGKSNLWIEKFI